MTVKTLIAALERRLKHPKALVKKTNSSGHSGVEDRLIALLHSLNCPTYLLTASENCLCPLFVLRASCLFSG